jgi:2-isopropylmalate synthase
MAIADAILAVRSGVSTVKTAVDTNAAPLEVFAEMVKNCGNSFGFESDINYTQLNRIIKQIKWIADNSKSGKASVVSNETVENGITLNANDERETVMTAVLKLGYDLSEEDSSKVYEEFTRVAEKKTVGAKELDAIVASVALQVPATYKLISYVINNGNIISSSAQIRLSKGEDELEGICIGDGPVDAAFRAVEQIIGRHYELDDFQIQTVTEGRDSMGSALVRLRENGKLYSGTGISTDILGASIRAYINALNKIVFEEE